MIDPKLSGKVAIVTGANQGIGEATARALAAEGVAVLVHGYRMDPGEHAADEAYPTEYGELRARAPEEVASAIRHSGNRAVAVEADLSDPSAPRALFDLAEAELGPVDILVNNASAWLANSFLAMSTDRLGRALARVDASGHDRQFAVDARAAALLIAEFAKRYLARGATSGRIVGLTSGGSQGFPEEVSYGAAKAAQENYTMSAARELGPYGVTANIVYPPATDTGWVTAAVREAVEANATMRHVGTPGEVAELIVFLVSHQGRHVTGNVIRMG